MVAHIFFCWLADLSMRLHLLFQSPILMKAGNGPLKPQEKQWLYIWWPWYFVFHKTQQKWLPMFWKSIHICRKYLMNGEIARLWTKCSILFLPEASFGLRVLSLPVSVCVCVYQSLACPDDNSSPVQARITKFGPEKQNTLVKFPIVLGGKWPWPSRSNLTPNSKLTPFWACPNHNSPPILVRISKFGQQMHFSTVKMPVNSGLDWPWTSPSFLIRKLFFFSLWRCALRLWKSTWYDSMLFRDCFTVSTPVHMGNAQPKWNGANGAVVLNSN